MVNLNSLKMIFKIKMVLIIIYSNQLTCCVLQFVLTQMWLILVTSLFGKMRNEISNLKSSCSFFPSSLSFYQYFLPGSRINILQYPYLQWLASARPPAVHYYILYAQKLI